MKSTFDLPYREAVEEAGSSRRAFLKASLVGSLATAAAGVPIIGEGTGALPEENTRTSSLISIVNAAPSAPLQNPWKSTISTGYAPLLLRADLQQHLAILQREIGYIYCRFHGIFHDDMGVVARREDGSLAFRWAQVDQLFDALRRLGLRPRVELSSMPVALASGTATIFDWGFNVTPPRDYGEWGQLVGAFARHCLERYGLDEIAQWFFEVWNEPNIDFWTGSQQDYWKLYDVSAIALKAVSPRLRVGGPVSAHAGWVAEMIAHCSTQGVPLDFISTHIYPQDEFHQYPGLRESPYKPGTFIADIVRGVRETVRRSAMPNLEVHITEWNSLVPLPNGEILWNHNPSVDNAAAAATVCDIALTIDGDCSVFCWWDASDVFEESGMPQNEFSGTYGLLTLNGLPKATFNAFRFLNRLRGGRLELQHEPLAPGCNLVATTEGDSLCVLLWYRDLLAYGVGGQQPWKDILNIPWTESAKPILFAERITPGAGSCYETWKSLGTPQNLSPAERRLLEAHSVPEARLFQPELQNGRIHQPFQLSPGEVLYLELRPQGALAMDSGRKSWQCEPAGR